jgi:hypothetical protein
MSELLETTATDDYAFQAEALSEGWSDGLPVLAPTPERVAAMLAAVDAPRELSFGPVPPAGRLATLESVAANAVLAGMRPEWFPVLAASLAATLDPAFNLEGVQTTTHNTSTLIVVNGPARELGFASGAGALGPGSPADATTGRALRLCLRNIGGARAPLPDRATLGSPAKFTYCLAEAEEANPWWPLHVDRGFAVEESVVTVFAGEAPHNLQDHINSTAEGILSIFASDVGLLASNQAYYMGEILVVLGPEHAETIASAGWTKTDVRDYLFDRARNTMGDLKRAGGDVMAWWPAWFRALGEHDLVPIVEHPEDLLVMVAGGPGKHSAAIHGWGPTKCVSRPVLTRGLEALAHSR